MTKKQQKALLARAPIMTAKRQRQLLEKYFFPDGLIEALDVLDKANKRIAELEKAFGEECRARNAYMVNHLDNHLPLLNACRKIQWRKRKLTPEQEKVFAPVQKVLKMITMRARLKSRRRRQ